MCACTFLLFPFSAPLHLFLVSYFSHSTSSAWASPSTSLLSWQFFVIVEVVDVCVFVCVRVQCSSSILPLRLEHAALIKLYNLINIDTCQFLPNEISFGSLFFESFFVVVVLVVLSCGRLVIVFMDFYQAILYNKKDDKEAEPMRQQQRHRHRRHHKASAFDIHTHTAKWIAKETQTEMPFNIQWQIHG